MTTPTQHCPLRREMVTEGTCNTCNRYYLIMGIRPFITCSRGHHFRPAEAICQGPAVYCPTCKDRVFVDAPKEPGFCCDYISCDKTCDWHGDPDHCNMSRNPEDARKMLLREYVLTDPGSGKEYTIKGDGYLVTTQQMANQQGMELSDKTVQAMASQVEQELLKLKWAHKGNVDTICAEIQDGYNKILRAHYPRAKVVVQFDPHEQTPKIAINGGNSVTAWLLHRIVETLETKEDE